MHQKTIEAAYAGLFHDFGKILQRSQLTPWQLPEGIEREGQPVHACWTQKFAEDADKNYRSAALHSAFHHNPEKSPAADHYLSYLISVADKLSAGERSDEESEKDNKNPPKQMRSIFDRVGANRTDSTKPKNYLPLDKITLSEDAIFPRREFESKPAKSYERIVQALKESLKQVSGDAETDLERLLVSLRDNAWSVPSSYYYDIPDVSLYDHSRTTAAIAVCLRDLPESMLVRLFDALQASFKNNSLPQEQQDLLDQPAALLVGGSFSGIQNFIYTVAGDKAAQSLRGRSFFLQILTEVILRYVLKRLEIPYCNVIYSGGGAFYLIAPLTAGDVISQLQAEISGILLRYHGTSLYLSLAFCEIPFSGFKKGAFPVYWNRMHEKLNEKKQHRYTELGANMHQLIFTPEAHGGNREDICSVCGEEKEKTSLIDPQKEDRICPTCRSFADVFGGVLPRTAYIRLSIGKPIETEPGSIENTLAAFGAGLELFDKKGIPLSEKSLIPEPERFILWETDDPASDWHPPVADRPCVTWRRYMLNRIPRATFDEMQEAIPAGIKRLGVLRMDVDNLGSLFKDGFGKGEKSIATFSRISTLSFQMSLFFEGYLKKICEKYQNIYSVYSGGDDLFLIGPWQEITRLAPAIRQKFNQYTCENPDFHISGGMAFIHGKYPVIQAAKAAGDAEEKAKSKEGKNAFTFLDEAWYWEDYLKLQGYEDQLRIIIEEKDCPASLLQLLQQLDREKIESGKPVYGRWLWMGDYHFVRMKERYAQNSELVNALDGLHRQISQADYRDIHYWAKAARWAQLALRIDQKGE